MLNTVLTVGSWGLFYCSLLFYIGWVVMERRFFAGSDPEGGDRELRDVARSALGQARPPVSSASVTPLQRLTGY